ncbi:MAG: hypothetical protein ACX930_04290 [Erythrobacter sp.]
MIRRTITILSLATMVTACATSSETPNNFTAERTVFSSPYVAPELAQGQVGPGADQPYFLVRTKRGIIAYDHQGNRVELRRREERLLERQAQALEDRDRLPRPIEPDAPPVALPEADAAAPR